jgi:hypothetical protein
MVQKDTDFPDDKFDSFPDGKFEDFPALPDEARGDSYDKGSTTDYEDTSFKLRAPYDVIPPAGHHNEREIRKQPTDLELIQKYGLNQYCTALGITNAIQGGIFGGTLGIMIGAFEGSRLGLTMRSGLTRHALRSGGANAVSFGFFLGSYTGVKAYMRMSRQKNDVINSFTAGTVAGMLGSLRTRSLYIVIGSGIGCGVIMAVMDTVAPGQI